MNGLRHLRELMDERDTRYQQRFDAQNQALEAARLSIKEGVEKAELSVNDRLTLLNELRTGVATTDQLDALEKLIEALTIRIQIVETTRTASQSQIRGIYAAIAAAVSVIGLVVLLSNGVIG